MTKYLTRVATFLAVTLTSSGLFGSPQMPDYIIINGDTMPTYNLLLEPYLEMLDSVDRSQLFGLTFRDEASFNCWRGYQAIYLAQGDSLFLVNIINCGGIKSHRKDDSVGLNKMKSIFGSLLRENRVFIYWFSGTISYPTSNSVLRWDGVFYKIFEKEMVIAIKSGKVIDRRDVTNYVDDPRRIDRKDKMGIAGIIVKNLQKAKWKSMGRYDCSAKYIITISKAGTISKVDMNYTKEEIQDWYDMEEYKYCTRKIYDSIKSLKFDIIKDKGLPIVENIYIEIFVDEDGKIENWTE
jgi:hypothetical protein